MATQQVWDIRYQRLIWAMVAIVLGTAVFVPTFFTQQIPPWWLLVPAFLLIAAGGLYFNVVTIWHWKERYRGKHSDLWGAILILETSGWFKLVYLFRHIIPDARGRGRYVRMSDGSIVDTPHGSGDTRPTL